MMDMLLSHPHFFWLSLGGLLLIAEILGGNGYLLWSGVAAIATGIIIWLLPLGREWQGVLFSVLILLSVWLWWRWLNRQKRNNPKNFQLNQRGQQLIGMHLVLDKTLSNGRGHIRVGDSSWPVVADDDLIAGTKVKVLAIEGITLKIEILPELSE